MELEERNMKLEEELAEERNAKYESEGSWQDPEERV